MNTTNRKIYLDYAASTPLDTRIIMNIGNVENVITTGNAASVHSFGRAQQQLVDTARDTIASFVQAERVEDVVFTSGATESNNMVIVGAVMAARARLRGVDGGRLAWPHVVTTTIEHSSILEPLRWLEANQFCTVTYLDPDASGLVTDIQVLNAMSPQTCLVSIQYANNEIGTVQPIGEIGAAIKELKSASSAYEHLVFHTDAVQAAQYLDCSMPNLQVDAISLSAHKVYGPHGVGALVCSKPLEPLIQGGGQEFGKRAGTVNTAGIAQFGAAVALLQENKEHYVTHAREVYNYTVQKVTELIPNTQINGINPAKYGADDDSFTEHVPHILNISIPKTSAEDSITKLDLAGIAISAGSACHAGAIEPSHVITAIAKDTADLEWRVNSAIRLSWGKDSSTQEIDAVLKFLTIKP